MVGLPKPTLYRDLGGLGENRDWVLVDGPPRVTALARSAVAASDLVPISSNWHHSICGRPGTS